MWRLAVVLATALRASSLFVTLQVSHHVMAKGVFERETSCYGADRHFLGSSSDIVKGKAAPLQARRVPGS